jgi:hypothetical protein
MHHGKPGCPPWRTATFRYASLHYGLSFLCNPINAQFTILQVVVFIEEQISEKND